MSLVNGVKNCESITDLLNGIIVDTGKAIDIDNQQIWRGFLHQPEVNNDFWSDTIQAMEMLERECRDNFKGFNREAVWTAREAFDLSRADHPRCMDQSKNKGKTWKLIMTIREVINAINELEIPNK
jgi:hypothetical protein